MSAHRTFLIVDDDVDSRFLARHALEKAFPAARVIECSTVDDALQAAARERLDGVVTDHVLGGTDGVVFIRELRMQGADCPIVMVTASSDPRVHRRAYESGAAHVFADGDYDFVAYFRAALSDRPSAAGDAS